MSPLREGSASNVGGPSPTVACGGTGDSRQLLLGGLLEVGVFTVVYCHENAVFKEDVFGMNFY